MTKIINWAVRFKNPVFVSQFILAIVTPILSYFGLVGADITSWATLGDTLFKAISNPYVCMLVLVSTLNAINDPTAKGVQDSKRALNYIVPTE